MATLILDPHWEHVLKVARDAQNAFSRDEVWDGVLVVPPNANNEHQQVVMDLCYAFCNVVDRAGGDRVLPGANVSDRDHDWIKNYRDPDAVVYLVGNPALDRDTHWVGGPDLLVEVVSPGEDPRQKFGFYETVSTREVLVVSRNPWSLELYRLTAGRLRIVGRSDVSDPMVLASDVLPVSFRLRDAAPRAAIVVTHAATGQVWTA